MYRSRFPDTLLERGNIGSIFHEHEQSFAVDALFVYSQCTLIASPRDTTCLPAHAPSLVVDLLDRRPLVVSRLHDMEHFEGKHYPLRHPLLAQ
jgi:hypothetical protein